MNETTTEGPLTATVGERQGGDPQVGKQPRREATARPETPGRKTPSAAARPFPWGALALAAIGWAAATGIGGLVRSRARRIGAVAARLAARVRPR